MHRREMLKGLAAGAGASLPLWGAAGLFGLPGFAPRGANAQSPDPAITKAGDKARGLAALKITDVQTILTAPGGIRLVVVKATTSEPGLYGLGCATFTQRARTVEFERHCAWM